MLGDHVYLTTAEVIRQKHKGFLSYHSGLQTLRKSLVTVQIPKNIILPPTGTEHTLSFRTKADGSFLLFCKLKVTSNAIPTLEATDGQMVQVNHVIMGWYNLPSTAELDRNLALPVIPPAHQAPCLIEPLLL